jgi:hypothetical protein
MQKIQFYLVPNRITVTTDMAGFTTEFRQVYTRTIKLYKGISNTIEFEIRNSDQRRQDVSGATITAMFFDADRKKLFEVTGSMAQDTNGDYLIGTMSVVIPAATIAKINPQQLGVAVKMTKNTVDYPLYADSQFGLVATCELLDGYNSAPDFIDQLNVFNYEFDANSYFSEIGQFGSGINEDYATAPTRSITCEIYPNTIFNGNVMIYATADKSNANDVKWTLVDTIAVNPDTWDPVDDAVVVTGDYRYIRFRIPRDRSLVSGAGARFTLTKSGGLYTNVVAVVRGQGYQIGDTLTIRGSLLGGADGTNDLIITVTDTVNSVPTLGNIDQISWVGSATPGVEYFESIGTDPLSRPPNPVDKIIIRN